MNLEERLRAAGKRLDEATDEQVAHRAQFGVHPVGGHPGRSARLLAVAAAVVLLAAGGVALAVRLRHDDRPATPAASPESSQVTTSPATIVPVTPIPVTPIPVTPIPVTTAPVPGTTAVAPTTPATTGTASTVPVTTAPVTTTAPTTVPVLRGADSGQDYANTTLDFTGAKGAVDQQLVDLGSVTVTNGTFDDASTMEHFEVRSVRSVDLDGDGVLDDVVAILWSGGGTGEFTDVLVYRPDHGGVVLVTDTGIGDRAYGGLVSDTVNPEASVAAGRLTLERYDTTSAACCPTSIDTSRWKLAGNKLVQIGTATKRAVIELGMMSSDPTPTRVQFLPGTERATVGGDPTDAVPATITMQQGQHLLVTFSDDTDPGTTLTVTSPSGTLIGTARPGETFDVVVPESGTSTIQAHHTGALAKGYGWFEIDLTVR